MGCNINVGCLIIIFGIIILVLINLPMEQTRIEPMVASVVASVCPPGWTGSGTSSDPCKGPSGGLNSDCQSKSFNGVDFNGQRAWAVKCGVKNWPGMLCPPNWTGIGTTGNPCVGPTGSKCGSVDFTADSYANNFTNIVKWADNCDINWSGVICPKNWTGRGTSTSPCIPDNQNNYCKKIAFDVGYGQYSSVNNWINQCDNGSPASKQNPIIMYSAGKWQ